MANKVQELETENKVLRDKNILSQIAALGDTLHLELRNIRSELNLKMQESQLVSGQILEQARKTNGRVNKTEEEIDILKVKYAELLATVVNTNTLIKEQHESSSSLRNDMQFFIFLSKFPKAAWIILAALYLLASNGFFTKLLELLK